MHALRFFQYTSVLAYPGYLFLHPLHVHDEEADSGVLIIFN